MATAKPRLFATPADATQQQDAGTEGGQFADVQQHRAFLRYS